MEKPDLEFKQIIQFFPDGIIILDKDQKIKAANEAAQRHLGLQIDSARAVSLQDIFPKNETVFSRIRAGVKASKKNAKQTIRLSILINKAADGNNDLEFKDVLIFSLPGSGKSSEDTVIVLRDCDDDDNTANSRPGLAINDSRNNEAVNFLSEASIEFLELRQDENLYEFIAAKFCEYFTNTVAIINSVNPDTNKLKVESIKGVGNKIESIIQLLGRKPGEIDFEVSEEAYQQLIKRELTEVKGGINQLSFGELSRILSTTIERLFDIKKVYSIGLVWRKKLYGTFTILVRKVDDLGSKKLAETFTKLASITISKRYTEVHLKNARDQYKMITENIHDIIWSTDLEFNTTFISPSVERFLGYTPDEYMSLSPGKTIAPDSLNMLMELFSQEGNKVATGGIDKQDYEQILELKFIHKNGSEKWGELCASLILDQDEEILGFRGVTRDISDRKAAEKLLKNSEASFRSLYNNATLGLYRTTTQGEVLMANPAILEMLGYKSLEELKERNLEKEGFESTYLRKDFKKKIEKDGKVIGFEAAWRRKDGSVIYLRESAKAIKNQQGEVVYYEGSVEDISKRKQYEKEIIRARKKAEEADRMKSVYLSNMSHEIRTPMNAIIGFTNLLEENGLSVQEKSEYVEFINHNGRLLLNIIDDIIDFSKIEAGLLKIRIGVFFLNQELDSMLPNFLENKKLKGKEDIDIKIEKGSEKDIKISTDQLRLRQVMGNLVDNALKFTDKGSISVGYEIIKKGQQPYIRFFVSDTGIGIPKDQLNDVFDQFRQVQSGQAGKYGGTGLGLFICKSIVELLGGTMDVESETNKGTTFSFSLPYQAFGEKYAGYHQEEYQRIDYNWEGKKILIAEDVESNFKVIKAILKRTKASLVWAKDGQEAVDMVKDKTKYDLVLMDIRMPVMNGYDSTKLIKEFQPQLPVIALTAYAMVEDAEISLKAGCDDHISKPVKTGELLGMIDKYLTN